MAETKTIFRFFTIADYEEEEAWLREQHREGWKMLRLYPPGFYVFERCEPEDVVYRLDFPQSGIAEGDYLQLFRDYGWEYFARWLGWMYFRKPASEADSEQDSEILSDNASRVKMVQRVALKRLIPLVLVFVLIQLPNFLSLSEFRSSSARSMLFVLSILLLFEIGLFVYCGVKLRRLRNKYGGGD